MLEHHGNQRFQIYEHAHYTLEENGVFTTWDHYGYQMFSSLLNLPFILFTNGKDNVIFPATLPALE